MSISSEVEFTPDAPAAYGTRTEDGIVPDMLEKTEKILLKLSKLLAYAGAAALALILAVTCANILLRPFGGTIRGAAELGGYLCALALGLCLPLSQMTGAHISAGLWNHRLPRALRLFMELLVSAACTAILVFAAREIYGVADYAMEMGEYIDGFEFSYFPMALALALGLLLQGVIFAHGFVRLALMRQESA